MKKTMISTAAALICSGVIALSSGNCGSFDSCSFFPMFTSSPAVIFETPENNFDRVEVVEHREKTQVKFRILEWLRELVSAF